MTSITFSPYNGFLTEVQECIETQDWESAANALSNGLSLEEISACYTYLLKLLPHCNETQFFKLQLQLPVLLERSPLLRAEQRKLAVALGQWHVQHSSLEAMHYFAKALQIEELQEIYAQASHLFIPKVLHFTADFDKRLDSARRGGEKELPQFQALIEQIEALKRFCIYEEDREWIRTLYRQASSVLAKIESPEKKEVYGLLTIRQGLQTFPLPQKTVTKKYHEALDIFRKAFTIQEENVRKFQETVTKAFKTLFHCLVEDALIILGPPPCGYDIRAMGSCGREEVCPYSDLEFMILIADENHAAYFKALVQILELQVASFGETSTDNPPFTSIHVKNPSGFHLDMSPAKNPDLILTPQKMAELQKGKNLDHPQSIEHTILKTTSLACSDPSLFEEYQKMLVIADRQERAIKFLGRRLKDYQERWKHPFHQSGVYHIKETYVELLNHLLSDMALYYGMTQTNTLDIIDALVKREIFTERSGILLKESVAAIYFLRIRLHLRYHEQKEEAKCPGSEAPFEQLDLQVMDLLERCYWLVLAPLYTSEHLLNMSFYKADLIQMAFTTRLSEETLTLPFIKHMVKYLVEREATIEEHRDYYSALSKLKGEFRNTYLSVLEEKQVSIDELLTIPTPAGMRALFHRNHEKLIQGLMTMTDITPTSVSCVIGTESRYLKQSIIDTLFDAQGNIHKTYSHSAHNVCRITHRGYDLHFKQKPSHPLMEYAIHNLTSRIAGSLTPAIELLYFQVHKRCYPVLVSQTIPGLTLKETQDLEIKQWSWMLLCTILTRPGDGRVANYVVHNRQIYCVDNDVSFIEPVLTHTLSRQVHFSAAPFCLFSLNTPLDTEVLEAFSTLDSAAILDGWIEDIIAKEKEYTKLFPEKMRKTLYEENPQNTFTTTILFREGTFATLNLQFLRLQNRISRALSEKDHLTAGNLLQELISIREDAIGLYVYKAYEKAMSVPLEKRVQTILRSKTDQSMTTVQYHKACLGKVPTFEEIEQKRLYSPEQARQEFLFTLLRTSHYATVKVASGKTELLANFETVTNETRQLWILKALLFQYLKPTSIALNHCTALTPPLLLPFLHAALEHLDLRYCTQIDANSILQIQKHCPHLKTLSLSGCTALTALKGSLFTPLEFTHLEQIDFNYCDTLHTVEFKALALKILEGKHNPHLEQVRLRTSYFCRADFKDSPQVKLTHTLMECVQTLKGHTDGVYALAILPDGTLVSGSRDNTIKLWDPHTGKELQTLKGHTDSLCALAILPDGTLVSGSWDKTIKLWDPHTGKELQTLKGHTSWVNALALLPDGTLVSGSYDNTIKLWDSHTGKELQTLKGHTDSVCALAILPDGTLVSGSSDNTIKLWDPHTGKELQTLKGHTDWVYALALLPDGTLVSGSWDSTIKLWDPHTGKELQTLKGHTGGVNALALLPDGILVSGSWDNTIKLWDSHTGKELQTLKGHTHSVYALALLPDGTLVSGSSDKMIKLWK